jgi:carbohydrate esterase-like sialic acid-specific acetylesterase
MKTLLLLITICISTLSAQPKEFKLYYLGGQSNMEGLGLTSELPEEYKKPVENVWIFSGNIVEDNEPLGGLGIWAPLQPGFGYEFSSNKKQNFYSKRFGPELSFGKRIAELEKDNPIAIIKYAKSGSAIEIGASKYGSWDPDFFEGDGINQYDNFLSTLRNALSDRDIDNDGYDDKLIPAGIIWMQGESDAYQSEETAKKYEANLKRMMDLFRSALREDDLPVVIGMITDSGQDDDGKVMDYYDIVAKAQKDFAAKDKNAAIVTETENYNYSDRWHYDSEGFLKLGKEFAESLYLISANIQ